jgi:hypothetical protein
MQAGDSVIYLPDPLRHGVGVIECTLSDGRIVARFSNGEEHSFQPHELELLSMWEQAAGGMAV